MSRFAREAELAFGRQLVSPTTFFVTLAISTLVRIAGRPQGPDLPLSENVYSMALANVLAFAWLWLITAPLLRRKVVPKALVLISILPIGTFRAFAYYLFLTGDWPKPDLAFFEFSANSLSILGFPLLVTSYAIGSVNQQLGAVRNLQDQRTELESLLATNQSKIETWYNNLVGGIQGQLFKVLKLSDEVPEAELTQNIDDVVNTMIRPLSVELMQRLPDQHDEPVRTVNAETAAKLLQHAWRRSPLQVLALPTSVLGAAMYLPSASSVFGVGAILFVAAQAAAFWVSLKLSGLMIQRLSSATSVFARAIVILGVTSVNTTVVSYWSIYALGFQEPDTFWWRGALLGLSLATISFFITLASSGYRGTQDTLTDLRAVNAKLKWLVAHTSSVMWERQRELSRLLHGPVQAELTSAAIKLGMAKDDPEKLKQTAVEARVRILAAVESLSATSDQSFDFPKSLATVCDGWAEISNVKVNLPTYLANLIDQDTSAGRVLLDIVREGLGNAVRHGGAKNLSVEFELASETSVAVKITNDGEPFPESVTEGLGTRLLTDCTLWWSRTNGTQVHTLACEVPLASSEAVGTSTVQD